MLKPPKRLQHSGTILNRQPGLRSLVRQARYLVQLQAIVQNYLPAAAAAHCKLANYREGRLILVIDNAHWVTRLRYQQKQLQEQLARHPEFSSLKHIQLKIRPNSSFYENQKKPALQLSSKAADALHDCAESIDDPTLRATLERLANNAQKNH